MEEYPLGNSDDEENVTDISSSDSDEEPFVGIDIRGIREVLPDGQATKLFVSKPKKKNKVKGNEDQIIDCWSDEEVEGEIAFDRKVSPEASETCMHETFYNCRISEELDEEVPGEMAEEIFVFKEPILSTACEISSESDTEVEGEICTINVSQTTREKHEVITLLPDVIKTNDETLSKEDKSNTLTAKGKSRILRCEDLRGSPCKCQRKCLHRLTLEQIKMTRQRFTEDHPTFEKERRFILNWFADNEPHPRQFVFTISGISVCWKAWTAVLGITETRFYLLKRDFNNGRRNPDHGLSGAIRESMKSEYCRNFLEKYFKECCDYLPNSSMWHLTSSSKKCDIYEEMKTTFSTMGQPVCSRATFRNIWKTEFSHVKIPKENRFSKCDVCCHLKEEIRSKKCPAEKALLKERRRDHIKFVREERKSYMERGSLGHYEPSKYLSIAIDGMDTKKTELPYSRHRYGSEVKAWHLKVHLVGVLIHGRHPICMHDFHEYPHDSNLTINILLEVMWIHKDNLPDTLFIQMDNTCKENKNQYVLSFLAYLVEIEVFDKIEVSFLPVGHTHIDVDQMFSRLSVALQRTGCLTYKDLLLMLRRCYTQTQGETTQEGARPQYARTSTVYAIREWLLPHMKGVHRLHNFHAFSIVRGEGKEAELLCRPWCMSQYDPVAHPPITLLKSQPQGVPELVKPDYEAVDLVRIRGMVRKCVDAGVFRDEEEREWHAFLEREERLAASFIDVEERTYLNKDLDGYKYHKKDLTYMECVDNTWIVDDLKERPRTTPPQNIQLSSILQKSADLERGDGLLPVYTGAYRRPGQIEREVISNQDPKEIEVGMLVAIDLDRYRERPLIAKVKETKNDKLVVAWMAGSWTTPWSICKRWAGRTREEWLEEVPRESIILFDFELTPTGKLRSASKRELKSSYGINE